MAAHALAFNPLATARPARRGVSCRKQIVVKASLKGDDDTRRANPAFAALLAGALMFSSPFIAPEEALAAKSSGRVGGSSFAARRAAPAQQAKQAPGTTVNNTTIIAPGYTPPMFGGFGYGFMPSFMFMPMGFGMFGGIFQLFLLLTLVSFVFSIVSNMNNKKDDDMY